MNGSDRFEWFEGFRVRVLLSAALLLAVLAVSAAHAQSSAKSIRVESQNFTVDVLDAGSTDSGARLMITRKSTTRYHIVNVNRALGRVQAAGIRRDEGRVVVMAERGFAVIDPVGQAPMDEVYGYRTGASPDGRWIAYTRFFPQSDSGPREGIVMYDTLRTPDVNHAAFPIAAERSSAAGSPVYPPADQWKKSAAVAADSNSYGLVGVYQWTGQGIHLAAMRVGSNDVMILADLSGPAMRVCTKELPQNPDRWRGTPIKVNVDRRPDASYIVDIRSEAPGGETEKVVFAPGCGS